MTAHVLIFAIGNESRGDDALGPMLLRDIDNYLKNRNNYQDIELLEDFQLQIEHAMDMKDRQRVLFIDAGMDTPAPFSFYRIKATGEPVLYSHALAPQALLDVYAQFYKEPSPDAYILCIKGESFELGESPTPAALYHQALALDFVKQLLDASPWDSLLTTS
jgi:hydrogenase maturation protease